jgi:hypothetical protein
MNKLHFVILFLLVTFFSTNAFADTGGIQGFAQQITDYFSDFWLAITEGVPSLFVRIAAWAFEAAVYLKFLLYFEGIKFAWSVAKLVLEDLSISSTLTSFFSALPPTVRAILIDIRIPDAVNVILNAFVTRAVLRFF